MEERRYILYDDRAAHGIGTEDASILEVCKSNEEACKSKGEYGGMACYSYAIKDNQLVDEQFEWNWFPGE